MKLTKGFRGKYFSLAAILACSVSVTLSANTSSIEAIDKDIRATQISDNEDESEDILLGTINVTSIKEGQSKEFSSLRTLKNSTKSTDSVEVITAQVMQIKGLQTLPQILNTLSGISSTSSGAIGQPTSVYLRGLNPAHTLVLVDGVRVNDISGLSGAQMELIDMSNVERVEVVRGAQSGIWGADASAGVINIITKNPKNGASGDLELEIGSNNLEKYSTRLSFANDIFDVSFGGSYTNTKGISSAAPKKSSADYGKDTKDLGWERDKFESRSLFIKAGANLNDENRLEFFIRNNKAQNHFDGGAGVDKNDYDAWGPYFNTIRTTLYSLGYIGNFDKHKVNLRTNYTDFRRSFYSGYQGKTYDVYASDEFNYMENSILVFGTGYQKDEVEKSAGIKLNIQNQDDKYLFLSNSNELGDFILTQSLRYDIYDKFDNKLTAKIGVRYNFYDDWFLMSSYKTGFKAPTLYQQSYGATKELNPEETKGYELTIGNSIFDMTYFNTNVNNAIEYGGFWPNDFYYNLDGKSKFKGVEVSAKYTFLNSLLAEISYTYLSAKDSNNDKIIRRPKEKIDASLLYFVNADLNMNLRGSYIGERKDIGNVQTGKYFLADYTINYEINKNLSTYFKVHNIFDKYYQELDGYGTLRRSFYLGFRTNF